MSTGHTFLAIASATAAPAAMPTAREIAQGWANYMNEPCVRLIDACVVEGDDNAGFVGNPNNVKSIKCRKKRRLAHCSFEIGSTYSTEKAEKCTATFAWVDEPSGWRVARARPTKKIQFPTYSMTCDFAAK